jgi:hypothetical protein
MSGAIAYMDEIINDLDEERTKVLWEESSGGRILEFAIQGMRGIR